jgi:aspartokinase
MGTFDAMMGIMPILSRLRHNMSLAKIAEGNVWGIEKRRCERSVIDHLTASGISLESVDFHGNECSFLIDGRKGPRFESLIRNMNLTVTVRDKCACLSVTRTATDSPLPSLANIMQALDDEGIDVLHMTVDLSTLKMVVDESEADRLASLLAGFYKPRARKLSA